MLSQLNCFKTEPTAESNSSSPDLPTPWSFSYNKIGAQIFYNNETKQSSYLNPITLKELQAEGKEGRDLVVVMHAQGGEMYGVDYGFPPEGKIRWQGMMPLEEREKLKKEAEDGEEKKGET